MKVDMGKTAAEREAFRRGFTHALNAAFSACEGDTPLTLRQAADKLEVSVDTLRWQIHKGKLSATKLGPRMWVVTGSEVERYARENRRKP